MTFADYQAAAARTVNPALNADDRLLDAASGLAEEAGEILAHVRKQRFQGRTLDKEAVLLELGDALWCLTAVAMTVGISLDTVATRNVDKLARRYAGGFVPHRTTDDGPADA